MHFFSQTTRSLVESDDSSVARRRRRRSSRKPFAYSLVCVVVLISADNYSSLYIFFRQPLSAARALRYPLNALRTRALLSSRCTHLRCHFRRRQGTTPRRPVSNKYIHTGRVTEARSPSGERPTIARTPFAQCDGGTATTADDISSFTATPWLVRLRKGASSLGLLKRPSARRGPGIVSVDRNVRSKCRCSCVLQFTS